MKRIFFAIMLAAVGITALAQNRKQVIGAVCDDAGEPLVGVAVVEKGTKNGTLTNDLGEYKIEVAESSFLEFSFLSFKTVLENVNGRYRIDVSMKPDNQVLDATVVIGYGTSKKSDLTGAVSVVDMDQVREAPVSNVAQALQGRVAGAEFSSESGDMGESGTILIRGARSIAAGNQPLIVVDGVIDAVSSLNEIDPSDILSISVLKDVSSTAIYGSRGANGVILITTVDSKPASTKFKISFNASAGPSFVAGKLDIMDASEYAQWRNIIYPGSFEDPQSFGKGTDWQKTLTQTGVFQHYSLSVKGHEASTDYGFSFGYQNERGVVINTGLNRYAARFYVSSRIGKIVSMGLNASGAFIDVDRASAAISGTNSNCAIMVSPLLNTEDVWNKYGTNESSGGTVFDNPYMCASQISNDVRKISANVAPWLKLTFNRFLNFKTVFSCTYNNNTTGWYSPSVLPVAAATATGGSASRSDWRQVKLLSESTLNIKRSFQKHDLSGVIGFTTEYAVLDNVSLSGTGYTNDALKYNNIGSLMSTSGFTPSSYNHIKTTMSVLGRVNYSYDRRYYVTFTARGDGASNFAMGRKWGFFPAIALRWSLSNERWFKNSIWLNDLSIRAGIGRSGNDAISSYMSMATLTSSPGPFLFGENKELAYAPSKLANSNLTWETTDALNVGFNFSAWRSRVTLEGEFYVSRTNDLLLSMRNSQTTGYSTYYTNVGNTRNIGVEFTLTTVNVSRKKFNWTTTITASHNVQTVVDAGNGGEIIPTVNNPRTPSQYIYGYRDGYPVNALWGYKYEGIWQNTDEIAENAIQHKYVSFYTAGEGRARYADINHDGILDQNDMVYLGCSDASVYGGVQNDFKIGKFSLGVYFTYSIGGQMYNLSEFFMGSPIANWNKFKYMKNAWTEENRNTDIPKAGLDEYMGCDRFLHDASYLRLKTVSLSYTFDSFKKTKFIKDITVGASADNLWLLKKYNGFDPDVNMSSAAARLDNGSLPRSRAVVFNLQMTF